MATRAEAKEEEGKKLQLSLDKLADWEKDMNDVEKEVEIYRMKKTQPMYEKRRSILKTIPKFWYIVLAENDDFSDYISPEDLKFLEYIDDIYVHYPIVDGHADHFRDFNITISFGKSKLIPQQEVTKKFKTIVKEDGEECIESEPVDIQWPKELSKINPISIKEKYQGKDKKEMSPKDKMNYRLGMKSFFSWFRWTGKKPGKEFRNGDEVASLLVDLFLNGVKFYILGLNESEGDEEELDSSEGEELDISDDDYDADKEEPPSKRAKTE